jgi:hypothetical protein
MNKLKPLNFDLQKLNRAKEEFQLTLRNRFDALEKETDIKTFSEIMKEEAKTLASRRKDKPPAKTPNDKEIRELDEKRKRLRNVRTNLIEIKLNTEIKKLSKRIEESEHAKTKGTHRSYVGK